jgi:RNA polymerase sigma-70 factor (ECF subfamily)
VQRSFANWSDKMHKMDPANAELRRQEQDLIGQIQRRETDWRALFGELFGPHVQAVHARCLAYLRNIDDAADATQETLFRAYRAIDRFRGDASLRTWLFAIADNECHTLVRKRARYLPDPDLEPALDAVYGLHDPTEPQPLMDAELVTWALERLGSKNRDVLQLRYFADLTMDEIAATLGIGLSAAKMRLYRAQQQMADLIAPIQLEQAA